MVFYEETFKKLNTIFQPLLENSTFFLSARFLGTKAEELKGLLPLYQRMKLFPVLLEHLVQR